MYAGRARISPQPATLRGWAHKPAFSLYSRPAARSIHAAKQNKLDLKLVMGLGQGRAQKSGGPKRFFLAQLDRSPTFWMLIL